MSGHSYPITPNWNPPPTQISTYIGRGSPHPTYFHQKAQKKDLLTMLVIKTLNQDDNWGHLHGLETVLVSQCYIHSDTFPCKQSSQGCAANINVGLAPARCILSFFFFWHMEVGTGKMYWYMTVHESLFWCWWIACIIYQ
jgi:hypothetical protein